MEKRRQKAHRILSVQRQLSRIEEQRMADLNRRLSELETSQRDLIAALNEDHALHGLFIDTTARRLRSMAEEAGRVGRAREAQSQRLLDRAAQVRCAERALERAAQDADRALGRRELLDIVERFVGRSSQASGKFVGR